MKFKWWNPFSWGKKKEVAKPKPRPIPSGGIVEKKYSPEFMDLVAALKWSRSTAPELKSIVLAQWILESGRGNSRLARGFLNFGGLKWRPEMEGYGKPISYEAWDGRTEYIEFKSPEDFIKGYWKFISRAPYRGWERFKTNPHGYIKFINWAGYTPPRDYYLKVIALDAEAKELLK